MKNKKAQQAILPEVHIQGGLADVANLIKAVNRKKAVVVFRDAEHGKFFVEYDRKIVELSGKDIASLQKKHTIIYFDFLPGSLKREEAPGNVIELTEKKKGKKKSEKKEKKGKPGEDKKKKHGKERVKEDKKAKKEKRKEEKLQEKTAKKDKKKKKTHQGKDLAPDVKKPDIAEPLKDETPATIQHVE